MKYLQFAYFLSYRLISGGINGSLLGFNIQRLINGANSHYSEIYIKCITTTINFRFVC